jgi:hypothetical protein
LLIALLVAVLTGCASATTPGPASAPASAPAATAAAAGAAAPKVGCAGVTQATAVTIRQATQAVKPVISRPAGTTYRQAARVQALFGQLCAAVTHPVAATLMHCPDDIGTSYLGTFYDGSRALGTFTYAATGCQRVSVTAAGTTLSTMVYGRAAAAAPHLSADLDLLVGTPKPGVTQAQGGVNPGGPNDPAQP